MFYSQTTFLGIDPTAGKQPFVYAALDIDLRLLALGQGEMSEVLAFVAGQRQAVVAISAPRCPNMKLMEREENRQQLSPPPRPGRWMDFRVAEYILYQHNIRIPRTASLEENCPNWMRMGFILYDRLEGLGYNVFSGLDAKRSYLEVYPHACYTVLLGLVPFSKQTLEGRLQRQLALHEQQIHVPDPMRFFEEVTRYRLLNGILPFDELYTPAELDALVSAFTAWLTITSPKKVTFIGNPEEGQIVLPTEQLKSQYHFST